MKIKRTQNPGLVLLALEKLKAQLFNPGLRRVKIDILLSDGESYADVLASLQQTVATLRDPGHSLEAGEFLIVFNKDAKAVGTLEVVKWE
jgi:uncharacterized protein YheU (UPF0270 family)